MNLWKIRCFILGHSWACYGNTTKCLACDKVSKP
ncbi:hypothetical protein ABIC30_006002 [Methylobacterium sp. 1030]